MRITFLTHYYPPEVGAPQARIDAIARGLRGRGMEVTVHTGFPNYPDGAIRAPYRLRPWAVEHLGGVRVVRSAVYPAPNRGFGRRLLNHASFALGALATSPLTGPADVLVVETPPLVLAGAAIGYARTKRAPLVAHVADLWPASAIELGALRHRRAIAAAEWLERISYRSAAAIVCPTLGILESLAERPEAGSKTHRIAPSVDLERFDASGRRTERREGPFRFLYAGTIGMSHGLGDLVEAGRLLRDRPEVEIVIAGDGAEAPALRRRLSTEGLGNVRMIGSVPHERVPALYADADAAVVLLRDRPLFRGALPTKMLEAMSSAKPVVLSATGEAADLVAEGPCGIAVPPERPDRLAAALLDLAGDRAAAERLGATGRELAHRRYSRTRAIDEWERLLLQLAGEPRD